MAIEYIKPSSWSGGSFSNPTYAYDGTDTSDNSTYASEIGGDSTCTWSGLANATSGSITAVALKVTYEYPQDTSNDKRILQYSIDGGSNWTDIESSGISAVSKTTTNISLSTSQTVSDVQVKLFFDKVGGGDKTMISLHGVAGKTLKLVFGILGLRSLV